MIFGLVLMSIKLILFGTRFQSKLIMYLANNHGPNIYNYNYSFLKRAKSIFSFIFFSIFPAFFDGILVILVSSYVDQISQSFDLQRSFSLFNMILIITINLHDFSPDSTDISDSNFKSKI